MFSFAPMLASMIGAVVLLRPVLGHCKIVDVAANLRQGGIRSHGFGVNRHGKYPWHVGQPGDAGADAVYFSPHVEWVPNPKFPCGQLATLPKGLDFQSFLSQAEAEGVATTAADGSFEALIFQVNRDGGGSCTCEYDPTATAKSWNRCKTLVNPPGIQGMWQSDRTNHTAKFQMPSSTICRGGVFKDKCLMRIRCGWKLRFGGCFALKTPSSPSPLRLKVANGRSSSGSINVNSVAAQIYGALSSKGALVPDSKAKLSAKHHRSTDLELGSSQQASQVDAVAAQVIQLMKQHHVKLVQQKANIVAKSFSHNRA